MPLPDFVPLAWRLQVPSSFSFDVPHSALGKNGFVVASRHAWEECLHFGGEFQVKAPDRIKLSENRRTSLSLKQRHSSRTSFVSGGAAVGRKMIENTLERAQRIRTVIQAEERRLRACHRWLSWQNLLGA